MNTINVVLVEPGKKAQIAEIGTELEDMQEFVGGSIERASLTAAARTVRFMMKMIKWWKLSSVNFSSVIAAAKISDHCRENNYRGIKSSSLCRSISLK